MMEERFRGWEGFLLLTLLLINPLNFFTHSLYFFPFEGAFLALQRPIILFASWDSLEAATRDALRAENNGFTRWTGFG
jgi:hypothetical protein